MDVSYLSDPQRLELLRQTGLLDVLPEASIERFARLASKLAASPTALVSLVDEDRQFFAAAFGLGEPWASRQQTPLTHSFCQHVVLSGEALIVEESRTHPLVKDNLAVEELGVAAYLGAPIEVEGQRVGALCAIDSCTRQWTEAEIMAIRDLATLVNTELELRKQRSELAQARQEAEQLAEARSEFMARASHELRTPLHIILNATEIVLESDLPSRPQQLLKAVQGSAEDLRGIVDELLELHKMEACAEVPNRRPFRLREELANIESSFFSAEREISMTVAPDVADVLLEDWPKIRRIVVNLIGNALKYAEGQVRLRVFKQESRLLLEVQDQGKGIPEQDLEAIFEPFQRLQDGGVGSGLGLPIARRMAELLEGTLTATSRRGHGSTFRLSLPYREASDPAGAPTEEPAEAQQAALRILVVDDNELNLELMDGMLSVLGHSAVLVQDSQQALGILERETFDYVMMDLRMPGMNGFELLSAMPRESGQKVYAVSADATDDTRRRCLEAGFDGMLFKPLQRDSLAEVVGRAPTRARSA